MEEPCIRCTRPRLWARCLSRTFCGTGRLKRRLSKGVISTQRKNTALVPTRATTQSGGLTSRETRMKNSVMLPIESAPSIQSRGRAVIREGNHDSMVVAAAIGFCPSWA